MAVNFGCERCQDVIQHPEGQVCVPDATWYTQAKSKVLSKGITIAQITTGFGITKEKWFRMKLSDDIKNAEDDVNTEGVKYTEYRDTAIKVARARHARKMLARFPIFNRARDTQWRDVAVTQIMVQFSHQGLHESNERKKGAALRVQEKERTPEPQKENFEEQDQDEQIEEYEEDEYGEQIEQNEEGEQKEPGSDDTSTTVSSTLPGPGETLMTDHKNRLRRVPIQQSWEDFRDALDENFGVDWEICRVSAREPQDGAPGNAFYTFHENEGQSGLERVRQQFKDDHPDADWSYWSVV